MARVGGFHGSPYSAMRSMKRVLIGSLAAASASASLAHVDRHAVDLEQDAAGLDAAHPQFRRALALAHAHFDRLLRHRHVREYADPDAAGTLHVARERAARGLDLARGDALGLERLEAELAEGERIARRRDAVDAALEGLAEFGALGCSMTYCSLYLGSVAVASRRGRPASASAIFLSWAMESCSMISPLKIQTFTPQVP